MPSISKSHVHPLLAPPGAHFDYSGEINFLLIHKLKRRKFHIAIDFTHVVKVSKGAKIRNQYNQVPRLAQDTNGTLTNSQLDTTNESQEISPFPAGDHKAHINRRSQRHSKHKTEKHKTSTKEVPPWNSQ